MKIFSTFSGIGGFEIGIQNAYRSSVRGSQGNQTQFDEEWEGLLSQEREGSDTSGGRFSQRSTNLSDQRPFCVGYSEIDKYAIKVYEKQFGRNICGAKVCSGHRNTTQRDGEPSSPEQGVESAKESLRPIGDSTDNISTRNTREISYCGQFNFGDITKIKAEELPDFDCLVGGFPCQAFSIAGKRKGFEDTRGTLFFDLARILRAKRPRLFVFENVKGLLSHDSGRTFKTIIQTIDELGYDCQWQVLNSKNFGVPQNRERVYIVGHLRGTPRPEVFPIETSDEADIEVRIAAEATNRSVPDSSDWNGSKSERPNIRRLTPIECERLQGFPDNWTTQGTDGAISDTQRYKMCGNAVTTNVVQAVFERIMDYDTYRTR